MITKNNKTIFSTDNLCLATFLKAKKCKALHITRKTPKHAFFNFENTAELKKLIKKFWDETSLIEPRSFYLALRELKTFLYDKSYPIKNE